MNPRELIELRLGRLARALSSTTPLTEREVRRELGLGPADGPETAPESLLRGLFGPEGGYPDSVRRGRPADVASVN